jgi:hypothetical protein
MPISLDNTGEVQIIRISGVTPPDEGDNLMALLLDNPDVPVDLSGLEHLHTALLQMLLVAGRPVTAWPEDAFWRKCFDKNFTEESR